MKKRHDPPHERRLAYRIEEVARLAGVSRAVVQRAIDAGEIRTKRIGRTILLHPFDVQVVFGFEESGMRPASPEVQEVLDRLGVELG